MSKLSPKELAEALTDFVNSTNREKNKEFIEAFSNEHRTLQQSVIRLMLQTIEYAASDEYRTDARNQDSKTVAQTVMSGFKLAQTEKYISEGTPEFRAKEYMQLDGFDKPSRYLGSI
jgi:tRNA(Met) C34 N-acetyltransferase TmcA